MADEGEAVVAALRIDDPEQRSLLLALLRNDLDSVRAIVEAGFKFHQQPEVLTRRFFERPVSRLRRKPDDPFRSVYLQYVAAGNSNMIKLMIEAGVDINSMTSHGDGALQLAVRIQNREARWKMIKLLMNAGVSPVNERIKYQSTSVHEAVSMQDLELVKLLVDAGAELNCLDRAGLRSPLHYAIFEAAMTDESNFEFVEQLVQAGANVNITNENGSTVLHFLCAYLVHRHQDHIWKLMKLLIDLGADLNVVNKDNVSPLAIVAGEDQYELVQKMMEAGADVNISKQCTGSPLQMAVSRSNLNVVELLLQNGADAHVKDKNGNNLLYYACELKVDRPKLSRDINDLISGQSSLEENLDILKMIVARGVPLDCPEYSKFKPFASAISSGNMDLINFFVEKGIQLETSGVEFPLHRAAYNPNQDVMKFLINKHTYDVNERNDSGLTPLYIAAANELFYPVIDLVYSGADVNLACQEIDWNDPSKNCQRTPLGIAMITGPLMNLSKDHPTRAFAYLGNYGIVDSFLNLGANMFTPDVYEVCKILVRLNLEMDLRRRKHAQFRRAQHNQNPNQNGLNADDFLDDNDDDDDSAMMIAPLIGQIALLKDQNRSIDLDFENYLMQNMPEFSKLMQRCSEQLQRLKTVKLFESITLYDLLIGKDVTRLAKNEQVASLLKCEKIIETSKIYVSRLRDSFSIAIAKRQAMDDVKDVLNKLLGLHFDQSPMILHSILTKLDFKDLQNLRKMNP